MDPSVRKISRMRSGGSVEAKLAIDAAVREWLEPKDAGDAGVERLLAWR